MFAELLSEQVQQCPQPLLSPMTFVNAVNPRSMYLLCGRIQLMQATQLSMSACDDCSYRPIKVLALYD